MWVGIMGIWERRRNAIIKNKRMVKLKDKDKLKNKSCKTVISEEERPPAPPDSGKQLAEVIARAFSGMKLGLSLVTCRLPLCKVGCNLFCSQQSLDVSSGALLQMWVAFLPVKLSQL